MPYLLPAARPVHLGRLVQRRVDAGEGRQIDDRAPADVLPNAGGNVDEPEPAGFGHIRLRGHAEKFQQLIDNPVPGEKVEQHPDDDDNRNKVRQIGDRLHEPLEQLVPQLVQQQRQNDRGGEPEQQIVETDQQRIADQPPKIEAVEKVDEMFEPDPRTVPDAGSGAEILKGDLQAVHGAVIENNVIGDNRQHHQVEQPVAPQIAEQARHRHPLLDSK